MILFHAKANGQVTTTPALVPQGSSMQDLVVLSELDYALCTIKLEPASGLYIPDIVCNFIETDNKKTLWTAKMPPEATRAAGNVSYQLLFTAADGTQMTTLSGTFKVPKGTITNMPESVEDLQTYTIEAIYKLLSNIYAKVLEVGSGGGTVFVTISNADVGLVSNYSASEIKSFVDDGKSVFAVLGGNFFQLRFSSDYLAEFSDTYVSMQDDSVVTMTLTINNNKSVTRTYDELSVESSGGGSIGSISLVDDGNGNFTIVTTGGGTVNLVDDGEGNFTLIAN